MSTEERVSYRDNLAEAIYQAHDPLRPFSEDALTDAALSVRDAELDRLSADLAELTRCRDAALRQAAHTGQPIDVDMAELIRDGLAALGIEWEDSDAPDTPPDWLVDAVAGLVRPVLAAETERREQAEAAIERLETDNRQLREELARGQH